MGVQWWQSIKRLYKVVPPVDSVQLVNISQITMVYDTQITMVFIGLINQFITTGATLWECTKIIRIWLVSILDLNNELLGGIYSRPCKGRNGGSLQEGFFSATMGKLCLIDVTLWLFNIAMENDPFIDYVPIKTSIHEGFSMAMSNNQMLIR